MKKRTTILTAVLLALLVLMCAACGSTPNNSTASTPSKTSSPAAPAESTGNNENQEVRTLKCLVPTGGNSSFDFEDRERYSYWTAFTNALANHGVALDLEVVPSDQFQSVSQTRLASATDLPDFMVLSYLDQATLVKLAKQGMLLPINEIVEKGDGTAKNFLHGDADYSRKLNTLDDGNQYWFSSVLITKWGDTVCQSPSVPNIRKDWLDTLNLQSPATIEEFFSDLQAFRDNDMNGNGVADEVAFIPATFMGNSFAAWFGLGTDLVAVQDDTGKVICPWYQEKEMKAFVTFMKRMVDAGIVDLSQVTSEDVGAVNAELLVENKLACTIDYATQKYLEPQVNTGDSPAAEYLPIGPLTGVEGVNGYATGDAAKMSYQAFGFTKACQDLEAAAGFIDFLYSDEYSYLYEWGVEGETYEFVDGKPQYLEGVGQAYWAELAEKGIANGIWLHFGVFPRVCTSVDLKETEKEAADYKLEYMDEFSKYPYKGLNGGYENNYMSLPTDEELDKKNQIYPDLKTCSDETIVNLISGRYSLDDYDQYVQKMKELGLDDYIELMTGRYERFCNS